MQWKLEATVRNVPIYFTVIQCNHVKKGSLENYHEELHYILPKETNLYELGLKSQNDLNTVLSHINSSPKEKLDGKTPIELLEFLAPLLAKKFKDFGIIKIDKDDVILKPHLLKQ